MQLTANKTYLLFALLLVSFCAKFSLWAFVSSKSPEGFLAHDSESYLNPARALLDSRSFSISPQSSGQPEIHRTPGYPVLLAAVFALFGEQYSYVSFVQILLSLIVLILVYQIGKDLWNDKTMALTASVLLGLDILSFTYSLLLLTETLFVFLLTLMLLAGTRFLRNLKLHLLVVTGILIALLTLVRPITYYLVFVLLLGLMVMGRRERWKWNRTMAALVSLFLPFFALVGGWQVRNYILTGSAQFSTIEGFNLLFYRAADIVAMRDGISIQEARKRLGFQGWDWERYTVDQSGQPAVALARLSKQWKKEGLRLIAKHPMLFIKSEISGMVRTAVSTGEGPLLRMLGTPIGKTNSIFDFTRLQYPLALLLFALAFLYLSTIYVGVALWFVTTPRKVKWQPTHILSWAIFFYLLVVSSGPEAFSRFRVSLMPILVLYAAAGLTTTYGSNFSRRSNEIPAEK